MAEEVLLNVIGRRIIPPYGRAYIGVLGLIFSKIALLFS